MKKKVLASAMSLLLAGTMLFTGIPAGAAEDTGTAALEALLESNSELKEIVFDYEYYREMYPDLVAVFGDDEEAYYRHFLEHGLKEGRTASASFSVMDYKERYGDLQSILEDDMAAYVVHYLQHGRAENRVAVSTGVKAAPAVISAAAPAAPAAPAAAPAQQTAPAPAVSEAEKTEPAPVPAQSASETKPAQAAEPDSDPVEEPTAEPVKTAEPVAETAPAPAETSAPAAEPTQKPVEAAPTEEPVVEPEKTAAPTAEPAQAPVEDEEELATEPTQKPAETAAPTAEPTPAPVEDKEESGAPAETAAPTEEPAAEPKETAAPTVEPAIEPEETAAPAVEPTAEPAETVAPTVEPTAEPAETAAPTVEPTETPAPTVEPVQEPEAHEHTYGPWKVEEKPTCTTEGTKTRTCSTCGEVETETIPVSTADIDHQLVLEETIQPVTCESWGFVTKKCELCGKVFENIAIKPLGHDWDDSYTVDKDATCTEDGSESIHCKREGCNGKKDVQVISGGTGHNWGPLETVEAACTEDGYTSKICTTCSEEERTPISALGHDYVHKSSEERTCTTPRKEIWECSRCGDVDIRFMNDPTFGTHTDIKYIEDVPPTCTKSGSGHWECLACGTVSETYTLEPLGHQWGKDKTVKYDECGGLEIKYRPCTRAKCYEAYDVELIQPGKGHSWNKDKTECTDCGRKPQLENRVVWGVTYITDLNMCEGFENDWGERVGFLWQHRIGDCTIQVEAPAAKEGYVFKGWRRYGDDSAELDSSQKIHSDNWENMDITWEAVYERSGQ